jgi:hypothetical protein
MKKWRTHHLKKNKCDQDSMIEMQKHNKLPPDHRWEVMTYLPHKGNKPEMFLNDLNMGINDGQDSIHECDNDPNVILMILNSFSKAVTVASKKGKIMNPNCSQHLIHFLIARSQYEKMHI